MMLFAEACHGLLNPVQERQLGAGPLPPPPEDDGDDDAQALLDWIEQAVAGFCEKHHAASGYLLHWREEEQ